MFKIGKVYRFKQHKICNDWWPVFNEFTFLVEDLMPIGKIITDSIKSEDDLTKFIILEMKENNIACKILFNGNQIGWIDYVSFEELEEVVIC